MPTAVGPTYYKRLFAPHLLKLLQKETTKAAKSHPSFTVVPSYTTVTSKNNKKNQNNDFHTSQWENLCLRNLTKN